MSRDSSTAYPTTTVSEGLASEKGTRLEQRNLRGHETTFVEHEEEPWEPIEWEYTHFFLTPTFHKLCLLLTYGMVFGLVIFLESLLSLYYDPLMTATAWWLSCFLFTTYGLAFGVLVYVYITLEEARP